MLHWVKFLIFLLLMVSVRGRVLECNTVFEQKCWNPLIYLQTFYCYYCEFKGLETQQNEILTISGNYENISIVPVTHVQFLGGSIDKMPNIKPNIEELRLTATNTNRLNSQFWEFWE